MLTPPQGDSELGSTAEPQSKPMLERLHVSELLTGPADPSFQHMCTVSKSHGLVFWLGSGSGGGRKTVIYNPGFLPARLPQADCPSSQSQFLLLTTLFPASGIGPSPAPFGPARQGSVLFLVLGHHMNLVGAPILPNSACVSKLSLNYLESPFVFFQNPT